MFARPVSSLCHRSANTQFTLFLKHYKDSPHVLLNADCCAGGGGFTSLDPESRRVKPDPQGRPVVKIVYTVLESQYQSSLTDAVQKINAGNKRVCYELMGYLLEELRTPENYDNFKKDLEDANVFIGSLIFIEDLAEKVLPSSCRLQQTHSLS